jgi:nitrite reductase (NADH) small subunit/3-phenylpropionate/trans-cinnamate dioxygenase ferredoxin subunit
MAWASLCRLDELLEGKGKYVEIEGFQLAVFLHGGRPYVIDNRCPHAGGSLSGGEVVDGCAVCPWHQWAMNLETGQLNWRPLVTVRTYKVRLLEREGKPPLVQAELPTY